MEIIIHRVNKLEELIKLPKEYGTEIDLRTKGSKIILNHEPFKDGCNFIDYIENYNQKNTEFCCK